MYGPFTFDFTVPFDPGRVAEPRLTHEVKGASVTLERIVVTPTGARVILRGAGPNASAHLSVGGATYELRPLGAVRSPWDPAEAFVYVTPAALHDQRGEWTLIVVTSRDRPDMAEPRDPWTFRFTMP